MVIDSGSSDKTVAICREFGAGVFVRAFDDYSSQKNFGIAQCTRPWVLSLDADEEMSPALQGAIAQITAGSDYSKCYRVLRRLQFLGQLLRFGKTTDRPLRLFPRGKAEFHGPIHEKLVPSGCKEVVLKKGFVVHTSYKNLTDYFAKFNKYTSQVAERHRSERHQGPITAVLMLRPMTDFISRYFVRLGFLDGYAGFTYAWISSTYSFIKYAKLHELTHSEQARQI